MGVEALSSAESRAEADMAARRRRAAAAAEERERWRDKFSVGGLKYIVDSNYRTERLFWTVFVTVGTVLVSILLVSTVQNFADNPVESTLDDSYPLRQVPFPSVTACKTRPGLEQFGLVESALNWVDPGDAAVAQTVQMVHGFVAAVFPMNADTIANAGVGTKLVAFLSLDGMEDSMPPDAAQRFVGILAGIKSVINTLMRPLLDSQGDDVDDDLTFLDVNAFFTETAINWDITNAGNSIMGRKSEQSKLYQGCKTALMSEDSSANYTIHLCGQNEIPAECQRYCRAYQLTLSHTKLQTSLLEHAISPPTVLAHEAHERPWFVSELAKGVKVLPKPPFYDARYKSFAVAPKCYYAKEEIGEVRKATGEEMEDYKVCSDFHQTITDVGVCSTFHASSVSSVWPETGYGPDEMLETKGTGGLTGLSVVFATNLMYWQLSLVEPVLMSTHDADSFATFIPGDFTDVDKEALQVPTIYQSEVALSVKVVQTDQGFKGLDKKTRGCYLNGTDQFEFKMLQWATYTKSNCVLDCKLSRASSQCGCVPWYVKFRRGGARLDFPSCELFGHRCFMSAMRRFSAWDDEDEVVNKEEQDPEHRCVCLPKCDDFTYYSRLASTSSQKLRSQKYGWLTPRPLQTTALPCAARFDGRLTDLNCDPASGLYKQRLGDFFAPPNVNGTFTTSDWERETAAVNIYFDRAKQLATVRKTVPLTTIMAQVGGTMGLYTQLTGWSFISLIHLVILMAQTSMACAVYSGRRSRKRGRVDDDSRQSSAQTIPWEGDSSQKKY